MNENEWDGGWVDDVVRMTRRLGARGAVGSQGHEGFL